jgi:DDE family transposase
MESILVLFCEVDEFWVAFEPVWRRELLVSGTRQRFRHGELHPSEIMTILITFHPSHYRTFKAYYTEYVQAHLHREFPHRVSYSRVVELMPTVLLPLTMYLWSHLGTCTGLSFIDATPLAVCHPARIGQHRVFAEARRGRTSVGGFYGFKLHVVVNEAGELLAFCLTKGNVDDRRPVPRLAQRLFGKLFGDKGYISQPRAERLFMAQGLRLITKLRKHRANRLLAAADRLLLRKRAIIETIFDQLKNISQIEHTRHRSPRNFLVNLVCGLIAYCHHSKKPSLHLDSHLRLATPA